MAVSCLYRADLLPRQKIPLPFAACCAGAITRFMKKQIKKWVQFLLNPHLLLCFGLAWMITNGWSYVMFALGTWLNIHWMIVVAGGYLTFLWLPVSPEKIVTVAIAIALLRQLFPNDQKTLAVLRELRDKARAKKKERSDKKERTQQEKLPEKKQDT